MNALSSRDETADALRASFASIGDNWVGWWRTSFYFVQILDGSNAWSCRTCPRAWYRATTTSQRQFLVHRWPHWPRLYCSSPSSFLSWGCTWWRGPKGAGKGCSRVPPLDDTLRNVCYIVHLFSDIVWYSRSVYYQRILIPFSLSWIFWINVHLLCWYVMNGRFRWHSQKDSISDSNHHRIGSNLCYIPYAIMHISLDRVSVFRFIEIWES